MATKAAGTPTSAPIAACSSTSRITIPMTAPRLAPSAMRMPISRVRRWTLHAVNPYSPTHVSTSAAAPKKAASLATAFSRLSARPTWSRQLIDAQHGKIRIDRRERLTHGSGDDRRIARRADFNRADELMLVAARVGLVRVRLEQRQEGHRLRPIARAVVLRVLDDADDFESAGDATVADAEATADRIRI